MYYIIEFIDSHKYKIYNMCNLFVTLPLKTDMTRKHKPLPIFENVTIEAMAAEGKCVTHVNEMAVFVPFVVPGDVVDLQVRRKKHKYCEIGYCYGTNYWHHGYATEALKAVIDFLFKETDIDTIAAEFMATNVKSGNVMKRCHMKKISVIKDVAYNSNDNLREDMIVRSITRDRYMKLKRK